MHGNAERRTAAGNRRCGAGIARLMLLPVVALTVACRGGGAADQEFMEVTGSVRIREQILAGPVPVPGHPMDLAFPADIIVVGDSVYIVDNGNDRLVVLDRGLRVLGEIGREGEGPGEFQRPTGVRASPGGVTTVDMGNARFTEFDRAGHYLRSWPAPSGMVQFGMSASGVAYVRSVSRTHHYVRIDGESRTELGIWPHPVAPGERAPLLPEFQSVEVTAGDTVHVYDEEAAVLYKYDPAGELLMKRELPPVVHDSVLAQLAAMIAAFRKAGYHPLGGTTSKDFRVTADGELLLLLNAGDVVGLLIDPHTYRARRLVSPRFPDGSVRFKFSKAALVDSTLYAITDYDVRALRIEEVR